MSRYAHRFRLLRCFPLSGNGGAVKGGKAGKGGKGGKGAAAPAAVSSAATATAAPRGKEGRSRKVRVTVTLRLSLDSFLVELLTSCNPRDWLIRRSVVHPSCHHTHMIAVPIVCMHIRGMYACMQVMRFLWTSRTSEKRAKLPLRLAHRLRRATLRLREVLLQSRYARSRRM
jgi:hypothetical protein